MYIPSTKNAAIQFDLIIEYVKKEKLYPEHGDNGGIMAYVAVHMMEAQNNLMDEINQISFSKCKNHIKSISWFLILFLRFKR